MDALDIIRMQIKRCESESVTILCCPEAILGGLADNDPHPTRFALATDASVLKTVLSPLASHTVTTIIGFSELGDGGRIYNSAATFSEAKSSACIANCTRRFAVPSIRPATRFPSSGLVS